MTTQSATIHQKAPLYAISHLLSRRLPQLYPATSFDLPLAASVWYERWPAEDGSRPEACLKSTSQRHSIEGRCDGTHGRSCQARWGEVTTLQRRPFIVSGDFERDRRC